MGRAERDAGVRLGLTTQQEAELAELRREGLGAALGE